MSPACSQQLKSGCTIRKMQADEIAILRDCNFTKFYRLFARFEEPKDLLTNLIFVRVLT